MSEVEAIPPPTIQVDSNNVVSGDQNTLDEQLFGSKNESHESYPATYFSNSKKELALLSIVENFQRQYVQLYPGRKPLLFLPKNECSIEKFVCTTIRPTKLAFKELYDYRGCAKFVSDYLSYEPLEPPFELPGLVPSPTFTLTHQSGNCFDYAILLVSLLRGVGYDAYVVSGYASKHITLMDESHSDYDVNAEQERADEESKTISLSPISESNIDPLKRNPQSDSKYRIRTSRQLVSQFEKKQEFKVKEAREKAEAAEKLRSALKNASLDEKDPLHGLRIHAWVLILPGKREVAEEFFIEPTTGKVYPTSNDHYLGIESIFNSLNYWINMQPCPDGLKSISFDLGDCSKWEFVFVENAQPGLAIPNPGAHGKQIDQSDDEEEEEKSSGSENFGLPPSWVDKIQLSRADYERRCPGGQKDVTYKNAKRETFAEYNRKDGLVSRLTVHEDESRQKIREVREQFQNRKDKLKQRISYPGEGKVHELFEEGRPHGLKEHILQNEKSIEFHFYSAARPDGLVKRIDHQTGKVMCFFTGRDDQLTYRSVTYGVLEPDEEKEEDRAALIVKITQKFSRNRDIPAKLDISKRTFLIREEKIRVVFHLEVNRIIASWKEFKKPPPDQKFPTVELGANFEVDIFAKPQKKQHLFAQLCDHMRAETAAFHTIKEADREIDDILKDRKQEESKIELSVSVYDTIRNGAVETSNEKEISTNEEETASAVLIDYLSPFLVNIPNPNKLTKEDAVAIKAACIKDLKERLILKSDIMQRRIDEEAKRFQERQLKYQSNQESMGRDEEEEYVAFCSDVLFRNHILEKLLNKHQTSAEEKLISLDRKLREDPRLSHLLQ